jgi:hypothetical protein
MCVNPQHLVPVTHAENMAEMLARRAYRARIADQDAIIASLQAALRSVAPGHPMLVEVKLQLHVVPTA